MSYSTPHLEKLLATLANDKLAEVDKLRLDDAIKVYRKWVEDLTLAVSIADSSETILDNLVKLLNEYRLYIDIDLIFDSPDNFLYRQKGQLKLDNSIIEEFLPRLFHPTLLPEIERLEVTVGPTKAYSAVYFESSLDALSDGGGLKIRSKEQDFAISKKLFLKASHHPDFRDGVQATTNLVYIAAECKTNLDKTMFQEASATAHDVKSAVPGAKYYLLCEWLDMTPSSTARTDIDEVLILRKAKRINSNMRNKFSTFEGRKARREFYVNYLQQNPLRVEIVRRFVNHVNRLINNEEPEERNVLAAGYF